MHNIVYKALRLACNIVFAPPLPMCSFELLLGTTVAIQLK